MHACSCIARRARPATAEHARSIVGHMLSRTQAVALPVSFRPGKTASTGPAVQDHYHPFPHSSRSNALQRPRGPDVCARASHSRALFSRSCEAQSLGAPATTLAVRRSRCCAPIFSCCFPAHPTCTRQAVEAGHSGCPGTCTRQAVEAGHSAWAAAVGSAMRISRILSCLRWETSALDVLRVLRRGLVLLLLVLLLLLGLF